MILLLCIMRDDVGRLASGSSTVLEQQARVDQQENNGMVHLFSGTSEPSVSLSLCLSLALPAALDVYLNHCMNAIPLTAQPGAHRQDKVFYPIAMIAGAPIQIVRLVCECVSVKVEIVRTFARPHCPP